MPSSLRIVLAVAVTIFVSGFASAASLGLAPMTGEPDLTSGFIDVSYNATTDAFSASGFSLTYDSTYNQAPAAVDLGYEGWTLSATIDSSGVLSSGILSIDGGGMLSGTLTAVGFISNSAGALEFLFDVTGGSLAGDYGSTGGVILGIPNGWTGSWANDFSASNSIANTFKVVPEPSTALLLTLGICALAWGGRRQG